jgi:hypothetical protein
MFIPKLSPPSLISIDGAGMNGRGMVFGFPSPAVHSPDKPTEQAVALVLVHLSQR